MKRELENTALHLYEFRLDGTGGDEVLLDDAELARAVRLERPDARRRFVAGRAVLRRVLATYLDVDPSALRFRYGDHGKPELAMAADARDGVRPAFNVSHSGEVALLAVAPVATVGVDVERVRTELRWEGIAKRFFGEAERRVLSAAPEEDRLVTFFRLWTTREAYLKACGVGLDSFGADLPDLLCGEPTGEAPSGAPEVEAWRRIEIGSVVDCAAAVVWRGPPLTVRRLEAPVLRGRS